MAEKDIKNKSDSKEIGIGLIFLLLLVGVFIIWVFTGGPKGKINKKTLFEKSTYPSTNEIKSFGTSKIEYGITPKPKEIKK